MHRPYLALTNALLVAGGFALVMFVASLTTVPAMAQQPTPMNTPGATPTPDATATALQKEKLAQEVERLRQQNDESWGNILRNNAASLLTTAAALVVGLVGLVRWFGDRRQEREKRAEERFQSVVEGLGSNSPETKVGAAVTLRTFLRPGYEQFYAQVFNLAVANLRLQPATLSDQEKPEPTGPLAQALVTVFKESYPRARDYLARRLPLAQRFLRQRGDILDQALVTVFKESYPRARDHLARRLPLAQRFLRQRGDILDAAGVNLMQAYLVDVDLRRAWMPDAKLQGADLSVADLSVADLSGAHLSGAKLTGAHLSGAKLTGAHLSGADLTGAHLSRAHPEAAANLYNTKMHGVRGLNEEQRKACQAKGATFKDKDRTETPGTSSVPAAAQPSVEEGTGTSGAG